MNQLSIKMHVGIGDLLCMKAMLDQAVKDKKYSKIRICVDKGIIKNYRNDSPEFKLFLSKLMNMLYSDSHYEIVDNDGPSISHVELDSQFHLKIVKPSFRHLLRQGNTPNIGTYIVVTTKIRHVPRHDYDKFKLRLIDSLNRLSAKFKIIIMGERRISNNAENAYYGPNEIYSIYDDIKMVNNVVDLTTDQSTDFNFESFNQDCHVMSKAFRTITIGEGGNFAIALSFSNILGYRKQNALGHTFLERMFSSPRQGEAYVTTKVDDFINELNSLVR